MIIDKPIEKNNSYSSAKLLKSIINTYIILIAILLGIIIAAIIVFQIMHSRDNSIKSGVYIKGINVSGLTKEQAIELVNNYINENSNDHVILNYKNYDYYVSLEQIEASFDVETAVNSAYNVGRSNNVFSNIASYINLFKNRFDIEPNLVYNDEALTKYLEDIEKKLPDQVVESSYYVDGDELIITNGKNGAGINVDTMKELIIDSLQDLSYSNASFEISTYVKYANPIDIDSIHSEIYKEPQNAYYTTEPYMVYNHVIGVDFENSIDEVKNMLSVEQEEYIIPLKITIPDVTINDIGIEAFPDELSTFETSYLASNTNRTTNLVLASNKIDGTVLMPGEVFSYNNVVGKRTEEAGFKDAAIYSDGQVVDGLGGGICQISSTLYDAVVEADLEIVSRTNHMFITSYLTGGKDATVVYGSIDFKFKNNRDYPIKIISDVSGGIASVSIYGLARETEYDIEIQSKTIRSIPFTTEYRTDRKYKSGSVIQSGSNGSVVEAYKVYKLDGEVVKTELLSRDTYSPMNKIIAR